MICWYCHWGWPQPVAEIYDKGVAAAGEMAMHHWAGHVVWSDENFDTETIQECIASAKNGEDREDLTDEQVAVVVESLEALLMVPEDIRCCEPEDYDGECPANFPPPNGLVMCHR